MSTFEDPPRVRRRCTFERGLHAPHGWEPLNPVTMEPYRRGRVVYFCSGGARP